MILPEPPTDSALFDDQGVGNPLLRKLLRVSCANGIPSFSDFARRTTVFSVGLISLDIDPSSYFLVIHSFVMRLIEFEAMQRYRTELSENTEMKIAASLRTQHRDVTLQLEELEDLVASFA